MIGTKRSICMLASISVVTGSGEPGEPAPARCRWGCRSPRPHTTRCNEVQIASASVPSREQVPADGERPWTGRRGSVGLSHPTRGAISQTREEHATPASRSTPRGKRHRLDRARRRSRELDQPAAGWLTRRRRGERRRCWMSLDSHWPCACSTRSLKRVSNSLATLTFAGICPRRGRGRRASAAAAHVAGQRDEARRRRLLGDDLLRPRRSQAVLLHVDGVWPRDPGAAAGSVNERTSRAM